jgi:hypothetical protein
VTAKIIGLKELLRNFDKQKRDLNVKIPILLNKAAVIIEGEIQRRISGSRTRARVIEGKAPYMGKRQRYKTKRGKQRTRYVRTGPLPSTQLGNLTGSLKRSIGKIKRRGVIPGRYRKTYWIETGTNLIYARVHEFGIPKIIRVKNRKRMKFLIRKGEFAYAKKVRVVKRPYFRPGVRAGLPKAERAIMRKLQAEVF